jgi:hypothetical protein
LVEELPGPIPYLLRVGVTGHRQLADEATVAAAIERLLEHIDQALSSAPWDPQASPSAPMPLHWLVISPLAKGADRIVARLVLRRPCSRLRVVVPLSLDEYRKDFDTAEDLAEFEELLQFDPDPIQLGSTEFVAEGTAKPEARNAAYFGVGRKIVDECELLIAVWDGQVAAGHGGTGEIVQYALDQGRPVLWINPQDPGREAVLLRPTSHPKQAAGPLPDCAAERLPATAKALSLNFHQLAAYHRDAAFDAREYLEILQRNSQHLQRDADRANLPASSLDCLLQRLLPHYARADQLALHYQRLYLRTAVALYGLAAFAVSIAAVQVLFFPEQLWLIAFEIAAMLTAVVLWRLSRREAWHEKWLHDRHLAEQLRTMLFTTLLGRDRNRAWEQSHRILAFYRGPDTWVRDAHAHLLSIAMECQPKNIPLAALKRFVIDGWISSQADWHAKNGQQKETAARRARWVGISLFVTTLIMATLHLLGVGHGQHGDHAEGFPVGNVITCLAIILPAWGAAVHAVNVLRDRERIAARSHRMSHVLRRIADRADRASSLDELRAQVARAEEVMATENLEWWVSLSFRELELPA